RVHVQDVRSAGVWVGDGSDVALRDGVLRDVDAQASDLAFGTGLTVTGESHLSFERVHIAHSRDTGVTVEGSEVVGSDLRIEQVRGRRSDALNGSGLVVQAAGTADVERVAVDDVHATGIAALQT